MYDPLAMVAKVSRWHKLVNEDAPVEVVPEEPPKEVLRIAPILVPLKAQGLFSTSISGVFFQATELTDFGLVEFPTSEHPIVLEFKNFVATPTAINCINLEFGPCYLAPQGFHRRSYFDYVRIADEHDTLRVTWRLNFDTLHQPLDSIGDRTDVQRR